MNEPTISIGVFKEEDGTFTTKLFVTGFTSDVQALAVADHMQRMFCGEEIQLADGGQSQESMK